MSRGGLGSRLDCAVDFFFLFNESPGSVHIFIDVLCFVVFFFTKLRFLLFFSSVLHGCSFSSQARRSGERKGTRGGLGGLWADLVR